MLNYWEYILVSTLLIVIIILILIISKHPLALVVTLVVGISYSHPFTRFKKWFPLDQITLGLACVVLPYVIPYLIAGIPLNYLTLLFLIFFLGSSNLIAVAKDIQADTKAQLRNISVVLSQKQIMRLGLMNCFCFIAIGFAIEILYNYYWYYFLFIFQGILIYAFYKGLYLCANEIESKFISIAAKGVIAGWVLVLFQLIIILITQFN